MFSLSSLVGSSRPERGLEFTPIGKRANTNTAFSTTSAPAAQFDASFDHSSDSSDTLHSMSIDAGSPGHRTPFPEAIRVPDANFKAKSLLGSGSNSIQDLQAENKELSGENYNLKVEVATLTKILKQTPSELHDLASENVHLKQEILRLSNELQESTRAQTGFDSNASERRLQQQLDEKEYQIQGLESRLNQQQSQFRTPPELLEQLEFLKGENQKLIRRLDSEKHTFSPGQIGALETENNELKTELYKLKSQVLEVPKDAKAQLERAEQLSRLQSQQIEDLNEEIRAKSAEIRAQSAEIQAKEAEIRTREAEILTKEAEIHHKSAEIQDKSAEIRTKQAELETFKTSANAYSPSQSSLRDVQKLELLNVDLKKQNEDQKREINRLMQEIQQLSRSRTSNDNRKLEATLSELHKVQSELRQKDRMIRELQEDRESEVGRTQAKLTSLQREVQAKDEEEASLKAQIRTLLNQQSHGMSSASVQHYEAQLDQMRQKEDRLARENRSLKDEVAALHDELYRINISKRNDHTEKHQADISELSDKLAFYEKEYDLIQDAMEDTEQERDQLKEQNSRLEDDRASLKIELESAKSRLRRLEMQDAQKVNESAIFELEEAHRKRIQAEQRRMAAQNEALALQVSELEKKLAQKSSDDDIHRSFARLQLQLSEKEADLAEKDRAYDQLQKSLREKEELAEALEARIRDLSRGSSRGDGGMKAEYEYQIRTLELEIERLREMKFENERLREMKFENERLREMKFENERLREMKFENERLRELELENEKLRELKFENEKLRELKFENEKLRDFKIENDKLRELKLENEKLRELKFENDKLRELKLENERLRELKFENDKLRELKFENDKLRELKFENDKLREMQLENERLKDFEPQRSVLNDKFRYEGDLLQKEELQRAQYELEKLRKVQFEVESLRKEQVENARVQRDLQDEIRFYKTKLDTLMDSDSAVQPVIALLESEVDNYRQSNKELHEKLDQVREKLEAANVARLQREKSEISAENDSERKAMLQELQSANQRLYQEKARAEKTIDSLEEEYKSVKAEKTRLEARTKSLAQELNKTSRHCTRLANRIHEMDMAKSDDASSESKRKMDQIQGEIEQLSRNLAGSKLQPKRGDKTQKERAKVEARVLRNESNFFKAKLFDINLKCNDLALMNTFMVNAIKSSDKSMKNDLVKMAQCGIYPDYESGHTRPKLTMKLLATFVLSMVKMKRRAEKARARAHKMSQLRSEIDRDRISLIAEK